MWPELRLALYFIQDFTQMFSILLPAFSVSYISFTQTFEEGKNMELSGITVLDLSRLLPGPFCTLVLSDLGARVIKVEDPQGGDYIRYMPPLVNENSSYFHLLNRGKESITLNLKQPQAKEIFLELVKKADVIVESFRPGVLQKLGLGFETLKEANEQIIVCSLSGFGQTGNYVHRAGHDLNFIALSGILSGTGVRDNFLAIPGVQIADLSGALYGVIGILAGLIERNKTHTAKMIDISLTASAQSLAILSLAQSIDASSCFNPGYDTLNGKMVSYNIYKTKDNRFMAIGIIEPKFWIEFCQAIDKPHLLHCAADEAYKSEAFEEITQLFFSKTQKEWIEFFAAKDLCCEPVLYPNEVAYFSEKNLSQRIVQSDKNNILILSTPVSSKQIDNTFGPGLGEHNEKTLNEIGYDSATIMKWKEQGIL